MKKKLLRTVPAIHSSRTVHPEIRVIQNSKEPIELIEAVRQACDRSERADLYIGHVFEQKNNSKLRSICTAVIETSGIERVGEHPTKVRWIKKTVGDAGDVGDSQKYTPQQQNKKNEDDFLKNLQEIEEKKICKR
jgi:hypothetical protein